MEVTENINKKKIEQWTEKLISTSNVSTKEFDTLLKEIFGRYIVCADQTTSDNLIKCLLNIFVNTSNSIVKEMVCKTYFRILFKSKKDDEYLLKQALSDTYMKCLIMNGILASDYYKNMSQNNVYDICYSTLEETSMSYDKNILMAFKNINKFCKIKVEFNLPCEKLWKIICANLESPFYGIKEQCVQLFEFIIVDSINFMNEIFQELINKWLWTNKYKYYFLAVIFNKYEYNSLLTKNNILLNDLLKGASLALDYRSLLSAGQVLIRSIAIHENIILDEFIAEIIQNRNNSQIQNCFNQWINNIKNTENIYLLLDLNNNLNEFKTNEKFKFLTDNNYYRLIMCRFIFKINFCKMNAEIKEIDDFIIKSLEIDDLLIKIYIYEIILDNTINNKNNLEDNLNSLKQFFKNNMEIECSSYREKILKKLPLLFDYLAKSFNKNDNNLHLIANFFRFINENIFLYGIKEVARYQPLIFSLKFFNIILKCLDGNKNDRMSKQANFNFNLILKNYLFNNNVWNFYSNDNFELLLNLLQNEYDDVRDITVDIIINSFLNNDNIKLFINNDNMIFNLCNRMLSCDDVDKCDYAHNYCKILLAEQNSNNINSLYNILNKNIYNNFNDFINDPLLSVKKGKHIFALLGCLEIFYKNNYNENFNNIINIINLINNINNHMLLILNIRGCNINDAPSFEIMEESLKTLVEQSEYHSINILNDKKFLLLSIWMTLKSCGNLASTIGNFVINKLNKDNNGTITDVLNNCLDINVKILIKCRHKGAIEAAGLSLGKLIKLITLNFDKNHEIYSITKNYIDMLFTNIENNSTTRRGAGYSIMLHHIIRNDNLDEKILFHYTIKIILKKFNDLNNIIDLKENYDNLESLMLHYLCVLVKDSVLTEHIVYYIEDIMLITFHKIDSDEWTVRNAALQLFGSIVPKLVGQKQYIEETEIDINNWQPAQISIDEIAIKMPNLNNFILLKLKHNTSLTLIITFLEFLSHLDVKPLSINNKKNIQNYLVIFTKLLSHHCEKIRKLSSKCLSQYLVNYNSTIVNAIKLLYDKDNRNNNFRHGLLLLLLNIIKKIKNNYYYSNNNEIFFSNILLLLYKYYNQKININYYLRSYIIDLLILLNFNDNNFDRCLIFNENNITNDYINNIINDKNIIKKCSDYNLFGYDIWRKKVINFYKKKIFVLNMNK